ncbi:hotdog domain-containing protein (plasmid) [Ensifer adhaerens]|uniref:acyl-CoA thioesterase n=1 Tax=Ensifer adhaerens TaxID=106592 RepID=UPI0023A998AD|nr:hotdog domain-containing protein [Ensifer adhaerens]WDZ80164.1 hotdog domain-containing protein [Ensifer adhaerens]
MTDHTETAPGRTSAPATLIDIVFPGDTNHHGTLFGGAGLALMDRIAFIVATRHGRVPFVTASCDRVDFRAPARIGQIVSFSGQPFRVGRRSMTVSVDMTAEDIATGSRELCSRGTFTMVAMPGSDQPDWVLPPLDLATSTPDGDGALHMVDIVFPDQANSFGAMLGGDALAQMTKAAFIVATRRSGRATVLASCTGMDFRHRITVGSIIEPVARIVRTGRSSATVEVELWSEELLTGMRHRTVTGTFVMVAVDGDNRPVPAFAA